MAALPDGWVDTGRTGSYANSGKMQLRAYYSINDIGELYVSGDQAAFFAGLEQTPGSVSIGPYALKGGYELNFEEGPGGGPALFFYWVFWIEGLGGRQVVEIGREPLLDITAPNVKWSEVYAVQEAAGPFRLGSKYTIEMPTDDAGNWTREPPLYSVLDAKVWYEFFADGATLYSASCGPLSWSGRWLDRPPVGAGGEEPVSAGTVIGALGFAWHGPARIMDLVCNGEAIDLTGVNLEAIDGSGSVAPPVTFQASGRVSRFGADAPGWAKVTTGHGAAEGYPGANGSWNGYFHYGWSPETTPKYGWDYLGWDNETGTFAILDGAWAAGQVPALPDFDLQIPIRGGLPRLGLGTSEFKAATLRIIPSLSVHRPDGRRPSDWRWEDAAVNPALITEGVTETVVEVPDGSPTVERALWARWPHWAAWFAAWKDADGGEDDTRGPEQMEWSYTKPGGETRQVTMGFQEYYRAKHLASADPFAQEDIWNWGVYADLELEILYTPPDDQPALTRGELVLEVEHSYLNVSDEHRVWPSYGTNMDVSVSAGQTASYPLDFPEGSDVATVDLLFPSRGGPLYLGYVTKLRLRGLNEGTYRIRRIDLKQTRPAYLKLAFGPPKAEPSDQQAEQLETLRETDPILYYRLMRRYTPQWPTLTVATRGSFPIGVLPDTKFKEDELGAHGGSRRYVEPLYGKTVKLHAQKSLYGFLADLNAVEGLEVTALPGNYDAACKDEFGAVFGPAMADWLWPIVPWLEIPSGQTVDLWASATCRAVRPTNLLEYGFRFDHALHAGIEALVGEGGARVDPAVAAKRVWAVYSPDEPPEGAALSIEEPAAVELPKGGAHLFAAEAVPGVGALAWEVYSADAGSIDSGGTYLAPWEDCWAVITVRSTQWRQLFARATVKVGNPEGSAPAPPEGLTRVVKVAYGDTDRDGYVRISPLPANEERVYWLLEDAELAGYEVVAGSDT